MTFELLTNKTFFESLLSLLAWAVSISAVVTGVTYLFTRKSPNMRTTVISVAVMSFIVTMFVSGMVTSLDTERTNKAKLSNNVILKYDVEEMKFVLPDRYVDPAKTEAQEIKVLSKGKTHVVVLVQDSETYEPTLLDLNTGEPTEDLLRK